MKKNKILLADFEHVVDLIRNHVELTSDERKLWEQSLKKIENEIDHPTVIKIKPPKGYKLIKAKENTFVEPKIPMFKRIKNWFQDKFADWWLGI